MSQPTAMPTPERFFETLNSYQRTAALRTAIELDLFTAIADGHHTAPEIARAINASERGTRILCDYMTILEFLTKEGDRYELAPDAATFMNKRSPAYLGGITEFLLSPTLAKGFETLTEAVRKGGTAVSAEGTMEPDHPVWVNFARAMAPLMAMPAQIMAEKADPHANGELKILDIAASHGMFGLSFLTRNPQARVVAVDWAPVLEVARQNAEAMGVADRHELLPGSAFDVDFGGDYDLVLLTNFLHHFDPPTCESLLRRLHAALKEGGRVITMEFIPNPDRVSPPVPAGFSLVMLASTASGDAYTFEELDRMFKNAGFAESELHPLPNMPGQFVFSRK